MNVFEVLNGQLYQWDTGRSIAVHPCGDDKIDEVHFAHTEDDAALPVVVHENDGKLTAAIPNILLQRDGTLQIWAVAYKSDGRQTLHNAYTSVRARAKPDDYVYTETEVMDYRKVAEDLAELEMRVDEIEENGVQGGGAVASVNGKAGEVTLNAEDVGAIPDKDGVIQSNHLGSLVVRNANIGYGAVSDTRIAEKTITFQRLSDACVVDIKELQYTEQQTTSAQQQVARDNIAAASQEDIDRLTEEKLDRAYAYRVAVGSRNDYSKHVYFDNRISGQPLHVVSEIAYNAEGITALTLEHYGKNMLALPYTYGGIGETYKDNNISFTVLEDGRVHVKGTTLATRASYFRLGDFGAPLSYKTFSTGNPNNISDNIISINDGLINKAAEGEEVAVYVTGTSSTNIYASIAVRSGVTVDVVVSPQFEAAYRPTKYETGKRKDYTVNFGRTVYGGRYNWATGVLTVTHDANGELAESYTLTYEPQTITAYDGMNNLWSRGIGYNDVTAFEPVYEKDETFDPVPYNLPVLYLDGDVSTMSKDNAVTLNWFTAFSGKYGGGTCECKWQGSSSLSFPKKNYTIKFDQAFEAFTGWGAQKKYCFKANYIDPSHTRNICSCKQWGEIVKSRPNVPTELSSLVNGGAIDGFPCVIMLNGEFHGLYTWNIPKDGWMFGSPKAILCADAHTSATQFKALATLNGDFELEYVEDEENADWVLPSINTAIQAVMDSDGTDLDTTVGQYIDIPSAIDYFIHTVEEDANDGFDKNYILVTFDGVKWYFSVYDRDTIYGLYYNGRSFTTAASGTFEYFANIHRMMYLILNHKTADLKARAIELRDGIKSEANVATVFSNFIGGIPSQVLDADAAKWPTIPSTSASNLAQILNWYRLRRQVIDKEIDAMT